MNQWVCAAYLDTIAFAIADGRLDAARELAAVMVAHGSGAYARLALAIWGRLDDLVR